MRKFYSTLFLLSGILFGLTSCTKEIETTQPPAALSPSEANALLAKSIQSTEDDVIYLDMTSEQAKKMGITEKLYRDALAQIDTLNQSIRESKEKGITVVNGLKTKSQITKGGFPGGGDGGGIDGPGQPPLYYTKEFGPYSISKDTELTPGPTEDDFDYAQVRATFAGYFPSADFVEPTFPYLFNIYVHCPNGGETYQLINSTSEPEVCTHRFHAGPRSETHLPWRFLVYNASSSSNFGCPVEITVILINDSRPQ